MRQLQQILLNSLVGNTTNSFIWFALVFWLYLETRSVLATAIIGSMYFILSSISGVFFGTFVDHHLKRTSLLVASTSSLVLFAAASTIYFAVGSTALASLNSVLLYVFIFLIMSAAIAGGLRMIAIATLVTILVAEEDRAKANGQVGIVNGISFAITSFFSGLAIAYIGLGWSLVIATFLSFLVSIHVYFLRINETLHVSDEKTPVADFKGSWQSVKNIPGLSGLIFFSMINNFFGGVFMALADPYGLELVSVQVWGSIWGGLSILFIIGGMLVTKFGLSKQPLRLMFVGTIMTWIAGMLFALQPSIYLFVLGMIVYMLLIPFIEASEQTVLQKIVPSKKQGRVFGFAQTVETLATPIMTMSIGPLTEKIFIPFMTTGAGVQLIGHWFGVGINRGIGLVFIIASFFGFIVTIFAMRSQSYTQLSQQYVANNTSE